MSPNTAHRPRGVTYGAIAVVILGVLVVARAFDALGSLGSLDTQEALRKALDSGSARSMGVSVEDLTDVLHAMILIGATVTAVSVVMALFAISGHQGARWGLLISGVVGGFGALMFEPALGIALALAAGWATVSPDAAVWFSGGTPRPRPVPRTRPEETATPPERRLANPAPEPHADRPPATEGFGAYRAPLSVAPAIPAPAPRVLPDPGRLPGSVRAGVLLAWAACLAVLVATVVATLTLARDRAPMITWAIRTFDLRGTAVRDDVITTGLVLLLVLAAGWAVVAGVIALFVRRGNPTARMLLVLDAVVAVAGALAVLTSSEPSGIAMSVSSAVIVAATAVAVLLLSPSAAAYYGDHRAPERPAPPSEDSDESGRPPIW
jgi:hypothetical protein